MKRHTLVGFLFCFSLSAHAINCDLSLTPHENANMPGAEPGTELFCKLLAEKREQNLKAAVKKYQEVFSLRTDKNTINLANKVGIPRGFPGGVLWRLRQIMEGDLVFFNERLPEELKYYVLINRSSIHQDLKLTEGIPLPSVASFIGYRETRMISNQLGFNVRVKFFDSITLLYDKDIKQTIRDTEKQTRAKISIYNITN